MVIEDKGLMVKAGLSILEDFIETG